jgi:outer membrane biogenesis lipoprotein LolB
MRFRLLDVAAMLLAGCASQQTIGSSDTKSQTNTKNRDRDLYECEREAAFAGAGTKQQAFDNCMKARGYTQK